MHTRPLRSLAVLIAIGATLGVTRSAAGDFLAPLTGGVTTHVVARGETLTSIGARVGVNPDTLIADNGLEPGAPIVAGQTLRIDNRHLVPPGLELGRLLINIPQRMLFVVDEGDVVGFPVALGRRDWQTPAAPFTIENRRENPTWYVPASIREAARRDGRHLPEVVPPGPNNPLGKFWLGLSVGGIGIHGTNAPSSIYQATSHGCIRLHPDDIAWLYPRAPVGLGGEIVYEPVLLALVGSDVFLEVHRDVYGRAARPPLDQARRLAAAAGVVDRIDWDLVEHVVAARHGVARAVTR